MMRDIVALVGERHGVDTARRLARAPTGRELGARLATVT